MMRRPGRAINKGFEMTDRKGCEIEMKRRVNGKRNKNKEEAKEGTPEGI